MLAYLVRRVLYAIPILIGVNLLTFVLFFVVNSPDDMARMQIGVKRATPEAIERWKAERGYDRPMFFNAAAAGRDKFTDTIFFDKSLRMFALEFGRADDGRDIGQEIRDRMGPSLAIALPTFVLGLIAFVPLVGLAALPLQLIAWLVRGVVFQYIGLTALVSYARVYRGLRDGSLASGSPINFEAESARSRRVRQ